MYGRDDKCPITVLVIFNLLAFFINCAIFFECLIAVFPAEIVALNEDFAKVNNLPPILAAYGPRKAPRAAPPIVAAEIKGHFFQPANPNLLASKTPKAARQNDEKGATDLAHL